MKKTPTIYRLNPEWQKLQSAGLEQLVLLVPSCDRLDRLVRTIRTLVKIRQTHQSDIVRPLQACRERIVPLMEASDRIPHLVNAAKAIALVVRVCDAEWKPLLQDVCSLLSAQLQSCDNITHVVQILNCLTRLSPLIGEAVEAEEGSDCADKPAACLSEQKRTGKGKARQKAAAVHAGAGNNPTPSVTQRDAVGKNPVATLAAGMEMLPVESFMESRIKRDGAPAFFHDLNKRF